MKTPNQEKVWDIIAIKWNECRQDPVPEAIEFMKKQKGKILDLGCGSGRNFIKLKQKKVYGLDFSKEILKYAKQKSDNLNLNAELKQIKNEKIPYADNFFDSAIFIAVLHCIETDSKRKKLLKELYRVLKPNSKALISVWSKNHERLKNKPKKTFIPWTVNNKKYNRYTYIYDKEELEQQLKLTGFKILNSKEDNNIVFIVEKI